VGIGTASPSYKVQVNSAGQTNLYLFNSTDSVGLRMIADSAVGWVQTQTNHPLGFATNNVERMRITSAGNVGIGTDSPSAKLHVAGSGYIDYSAAGTALTVRSNSAGSGQGAQIAMTDTWSSSPFPNKYLRVNASGYFEIINSGYSQGIFYVTDAGLVNANAGFSKAGTTISSIVYADVSVTGLTTSFQEKLITLPNSITYTSVVCIIPLNGVNDIVTIDYVSLGEWSGVQLTTQARIGIKLGNAVASTTGTIRVYYRI
jgi:hypothetical protein